MLAPLDIFLVAKDGSLLWKGTAENFEVAKLGVLALMAGTPADYVIFRQRTGDKTTIKVDGTIIGPIVGRSPLVSPEIR